jgi:hypothetical protein
VSTLSLAILHACLKESHNERVHESFDVFFAGFCSDLPFACFSFDSGLMAFNFAGGDVVFSTTSNEFVIVEEEGEERNG